MLSFPSVTIHAKCRIASRCCRAFRPRDAGALIGSRKPFGRRGNRCRRRPRGVRCSRTVSDVWILEARVKGGIWEMNQIVFCERQAFQDFHPHGGKKIHIHSVPHGNAHERSFVDSPRGSGAGRPYAERPLRPRLGIARTAPAPRLGGRRRRGWSSGTEEEGSGPSCGGNARRS